MRGIGDPRGIAVLASLPERGVRGCALLATKFSFRNSFSGAAGRGGGIGSRQPGHGAAFGRGLPQEEIAEQSESDASADDVNSRRFAEWRNGAQPQIRVSSDFAQPQKGVGVAASAAGRGRGIPLIPQQQDVPREEESPRAETTDRFGRGRGISLLPPGDSGRGRWIPPPSPALRSGGNQGRGITLGGYAEDSNRPNAAAFREDTTQLFEDTIQEKNGQGSGLPHPLPEASVESKKSAVEELLSKLGQSKPQVSLNPESSAPVMKPKLPFRMPFARSPPVPEQQQPASPPRFEPVIEAQPSAPLGPLGRGRGQPGPVSQPGIGAGLEVIQTSPRQIDRMPDGARRDPRPPSPPRMQLSVEEARARAIAILEKGIEQNVAAEGERRRKAGMDKFADATEFLADRFNRAPGSSPSSQPQKSRSERRGLTADSRRRNRPRRARSDEEAISASESSQQTQLTPEQEAKLVRLQEEDTFKDRLHTLFLTQFEPEFAMEEFGRNPDIDEPPVLSLEDYLQSHKPFFLDEDAELSREQKWQEAVKTSLANAPDLAKLVEAYAGPGRMTARQQIEKLQTISQKLPPTVSPEVSAFNQRALLTLQNNPRLNMHQKQKLMTNIVTGVICGAIQGFVTMGSCALMPMAIPKALGRGLLVTSYISWMVSGACLFGKRSSLQHKWYVDE